MNGEQAQKKASEEVFPYVPKLLGIWHVNQCVLADCKSIVGDKDWEAFKVTWHTVLQEYTMKQFKKK